LLAAAMLPTMKNFKKHFLERYLNDGVILSMKLELQAKFDKPV